MVNAELGDQKSKKRVFFHSIFGFTSVQKKKDKSLKTLDIVLGFLNRSEAHHITPPTSPVFVNGDENGVEGREVHRSKSRDVGTEGKVG